MKFLSILFCATQLAEISSTISLSLIVASSTLPTGHTCLQDQHKKKFHFFMLPAAKIMRTTASWSRVWSVQLTRHSLVLYFKHQEMGLMCGTERGKEIPIGRDFLKKKKEEESGMAEDISEP